MGIKQWFIESSNAVRNADGVWKTGVELAGAVGNPLINTAKKPIRAATNFAQRAYQMEDEFFKLAVYMSERAKGTAPADAVAAANKYFFDYNDLPDAMRWVRDSPIGSTFISYTYFAIPAIARTAIEKPEKILGLMAALEGFNYASMAINGDLQEQGYWDRMTDEESLLPGWMQGRTIWGGLNNISIPFVESYKLSLANANAAGNPFVGQVERSEAWPSFLSFWGSGPQGSNPVATLILDLTNNQDWRGNPIWKPGAPPEEKVRHAVSYIYQNLLPSNPLVPGSYHNQKIMDGLANTVRSAEENGEQPNGIVSGIVDLANASSEALSYSQFTGLDRSDNEILARDALLGSIGIKLRPIRIDQFEKSKLYENKQEGQELKEWYRFRKRLLKEGRITEELMEPNRQYYDLRKAGIKGDREAVKAAAERMRKTE